MSVDQFQKTGRNALEQVDGILRNGWTDSPEYAIILENLNICLGQTILDAGCGNGYMAIKFSKLMGNTGKIYALDVDKAFIGNL
ncbi:class I SAM-dependent methyltransferase, partial [Desulfobacula sp.]|uniref:class I SAM-dependent methyltransferase n=1 Tax=Desulfobacula sp. TaxID=2593537 RepID=UPI0039B9687E|nr:methyltransferase [Desulfobacula sp.]